MLLTSNAFVFSCLIHRVGRRHEHVASYIGDGKGHARSNTDLIMLCPVQCDSSNRSDRVFHCFRHRHGEDGRAGQADGGILQHLEWDCNEVSDHDHVVSRIVLHRGGGGWGGLGVPRKYESPPSRKEWVGCGPSKGLSGRTLRKRCKSFFKKLPCGPNSICHLLCRAC